ncbi:MAG: TIGR01777 family protein [Bacteroidetes bacterium]|nr:MAG: TIGR01777 family protein [Bacteroidota bacterium]
MPTILITGGTGLIGRNLTRLLIEKGCRVIILTRNTKKANKKIRKAFSSIQDPTLISTAAWSVRNQTIDVDAIGEADYIVHLAGAGVAEKRWTARRKKEIVSSRTKSSALIVKALSENSNKVKAVISASAIGWYTPTPISNQQTVTRIETDPPDQGFLGETCRLWEESIGQVTLMHKRLVKLRTGIVLSNEGGAFKSFKRPIRWGLGTILGDGRQIISWIHVEDLCRIYWEAINNEQWSGVYNAVAPAPVTNKVFILALARKIKGNFFIPIHVPSFVLKLTLGEMSIEVLKSANISEEKLRRAGFQFLYPSVEAAFDQLTAISRRDAK